jgi:hemerythrin-like domain-containing protein
MMRMRIIDQLGRDHRNMRLLLDIIEEEMNAYRDGRVPDFDLLRLITEYILEYPDFIHHPLEDVIFARLIKRVQTADPLINHLVREHRELSELTRRFAAAISNYASDVELPREWLESLTREYLLANRMHMEAEERHFFPKAAAVLAKEDWVDIEKSATQARDPLFGKSVAQMYLALHERIVMLRG